MATVAEDGAGSKSALFHLAFPVRDVDEARHFYGGYAVVRCHQNVAASHYTKADPLAPALLPVLFAVC